MPDPLLIEAELKVLNGAVLEALEVADHAGSSTGKALPVELANPDSGESELLHLVATVTDAGDTVLYTPPAGDAIRLRWVYCVNDPSSSSPPLIGVKLGATEVFRAWALSKRTYKTGAADEALTVNLSAAGEVAVTIIYEVV